MANRQTGWKEANPVGSDGTQVLIYVEHEDVGSEDDEDGDDGVLDDDIENSHLQLPYPPSNVAPVSHVILLIVRPNCIFVKQFGNIVFGEVSQRGRRKRFNLWAWVL